MAAPYPAHDIKVGLIFPDRKSCTAFVQDLALSQGNRGVIDKQRSGGRNVYYSCSSSTPCTFYVIVYKKKQCNMSGFYISSFCIDHHGCTGNARLIARQAGEIEVARAAVAANPRIPARQLQRQVQTVAGVTVPQRMMYRARDSVLATTRGDYEQHFRMLPSLHSKFCDLNPESHSAFDLDRNGRFRRAFLSHPFVERHQEHGQRILGIDGAFMKHQVYTEVMLILVGSDGDNHNIILAVALCESEHADNCSWFIRHCRVAGINFDGVPVFSDRGRGLFAALSVASLGAVVRFCTRHIISNIKSAFNGAIPVDIESLVYRLQAAETSELYESILSTLALTHKHIADYIKGIEPARWTIHPGSVAIIKMYGWRTTNFVKSSNGAAVSIRHNFPFEFFLSYMQKFMDNAFQSQHIAMKWQREGRVLTPYASRIVAEQTEASGFYEVRPSSNGKTFVQSTCSVRSTHRVVIAERPCTCQFMQQYGLPCHHYIASLNKLKCLEKLHDACDSCYFVKNYLVGYGCGDDAERGGIEIPIEAELSPEQVLPPVSNLSGTGRRRTRRFASRGERPSSSTARPTRRCTICSEVGHNRRSCVHAYLDIKLKRSVSRM